MAGVTGLEPVRKRLAISSSDISQTLAGQSPDAITPLNPCSLALAWHWRVPRGLAPGVHRTSRLVVSLNNPKSTHHRRGGYRCLLFLS